MPCSNRPFDITGARGSADKIHRARQVLRIGAAESGKNLLHRPDYLLRMQNNTMDIGQEVQTRRRIRARYQGQRPGLGNRGKGLAHAHDGLWPRQVRTIGKFQPALPIQTVPVPAGLQSDFGIRRNPMTFANLLKGARNLGCGLEVRKMREIAEHLALEQRAQTRRIVRHHGPARSLRDRQRRGVRPLPCLSHRRQNLVACQSA